MIPTRPAARSGSYFPYLLLLVSLGCLVWAFWPTLTELFHTWWSDPQYSHGFLVPAFAAVLLWMRRDMLKQTDVRPGWWDAAQWWPTKTGKPATVTNELRPSWWGLPVLAFGIGLHLYGGYYAYAWQNAVAIVPCVAGVWILVGGRAAWRWGWPAVLFLLFMIPLPYRYAVALSGPLQHLATVSSTFMMQAIGLPALSEGNVITINDYPINVAEACSGLRMLMVFIALSTAVIIVSRRPWLDKAIILVSAVPIALVSNILRIVMTGVMYQLTDSEMAKTFFHDVAGIVFMPVVAMVLVWLDMKLLSYLFIERPAPPPVRVTREPVARRTAAPRAPRPRKAATAAVTEREQPAEGVEAVAANPAAAN